MYVCTLTIQSSQPLWINGMILTYVVLNSAESQCLCSIILPHKASNLIIKLSVRQKKALCISKMSWTLFILRLPNSCSSYKSNYTIENIWNTQWMFFSYYICLQRCNNSDIIETCSKVGSWTSAVKTCSIFVTVYGGRWKNYLISLEMRRHLIQYSITKKREEIFQKGRDKEAKEELTI